MEVKKESYIEEKKGVLTSESRGILTLENRKKLALTGIVEVVSFNDKQIVLNTNLGTLTIKGEGLKMTKLDVQNGDIIIVGKIDSFIYSGIQNKQDNESILTKLFK